MSVASPPSVRCVPDLRPIYQDATSLPRKHCLLSSARRQLSAVTHPLCCGTEFRCGCRSRNPGCAERRLETSEARSARLERGAECAECTRRRRAGDISETGSAADGAGEPAILPLRVERRDGEPLEGTGRHADGEGHDPHAGRPADRCRARFKPFGLSPGNLPVLAWPPCQRIPTAISTHAMRTSISACATRRRCGGRRPRPCSTDRARPRHEAASTLAPVPAP